LSLPKNNAFGANDGEGREKHRAPFHILTTDVIQSVQEANKALQMARTLIRWDKTAK
jgi:lysophospholipase L1-like esterase